MFRRKLGIVIGIMLVFSLLGYGVIAVAGRNVRQEQQEEWLVATSFYPVYVMTKNLTTKAEGVRVVNLTQNHSGCVHDYQLTTGDMRTLTNADLLVINGGDMELFLSRAAERYPDLAIVDASEGMTFLAGEAHHHHGEGEHDDESEAGDDYEAETDGDMNDHETEADEDVHDHTTGINGHVWLDPERYCMQLARVTDALCEMDRAQEERYRANAAAYTAQVKQYLEQYREQADRLAGTEVILFHDAFYYLSELCGFEVLHSVDLDADTALSAGEIAEITDEIRLHGVKYLLAERETGAIAEQLAGQTGCTVIYLEAGTSGDGDKDAYLDLLAHNLEELRGMEP